MLKYSAHLDLFLQDLYVNDRIAKFAELGFPGFELWCWWDEKYNLDEILAAAKKHQLEIAAICTKFITLTDPAFRSEYLAALKDTIRICKKLNCKTIISQVGNELPDKSRKEQKTSLIEGLKESAKILESTGLTLAVEPLNLLVDHAGYFLSTSAEGAEIVQAVNSQSVKMLFDIYHQQITEGNLISNIRKYAPIIGHYHIADHPGRNEPGSGEINYTNVLSAVAETGYNDYIGWEFTPTGDQK